MNEEETISHGAESGCPIEMCQECFDIDNN